MKYSVEDIELAIKNKYIIKDHSNDYCISIKIIDDRVYDIWYKDIDLENIIMTTEEFIQPDFIIKICTNTFDLQISKLFRSIGYDN